MERILYQDIHLDFHRWDILPAPAGEDSSDSSDSSDPECDSDWADAWRTSIYPGSLPLLLRTLDQRPDLGIYVRSVLVDWLGEDISASSPRELSMKYGAMIQLFERCPRLQRLVIPTLPPDEVIAKFSCAQMTTLACGYDSSKVPAMVRKCPSLRSLQCVDCKKWNHSPCLLWQGPFPRHNLAALELHGEGNDAAGFVMQALQLCTASVQELTISYSNGWGTIGPEIPRLDPDIGQNLITLRIKGVCASTSKGFCILKDSPRKFGQILRNLPALKHLHLTRHAPLTPESFTLLPRGLRSLTLSCYGLTAYGDRYTRNEYIHALASCLRSPAGRARNVTKIIALGVEEFNSRILGDLQPLRQLCDVEGISFLEEEGDTTYCYSSAIRIICKSMIVIQNKILTHSL